jgi:chromate reductase, NAD(P)H dehydrogenase (quinone)
MTSADAAVAGGAMSTIIGLCGSLRRGSFNLMLLRAAAEAAPAGTSLEIASIRGFSAFASRTR